MKSRLKSVLNNLKEERGAVLPAILITLLLGMAVLMPSLLSFNHTGIVSGNMYEAKDQELYAADAGASDALYLLAVNAAYSEETILALLAQVEDGDPEKHIYDFTDPQNNKTVHVEISIEGDYYVVKSTATGPDGSTTTVEVWAKPPVLPEAKLFSAVSLNGDLKLQSDLGTADRIVGEAVGTGDGVTTQFELDCLYMTDNTEVINPDKIDLSQRAEYEVAVTAGGLPLERGGDPDDPDDPLEVADYWINWVQCELEFNEPPIGPIVATYSYCEKVNLYANGDINIQGASCKVFGDAWVPLGNTVTSDQCKLWYGDIVNTRKLSISTKAIPEIPETTIPGNYTANDGTSIGDVHITGGLTLKGDVTITGTVWVDEGINITAANVYAHGINPETGFPYFLVSESTGAAISFTGGYIEALLYAPNGLIDIGGGASLFGASVAYGDIDCMGSSNLLNALPLERAPYGFFPMDVQSWKIY